MQRIELLGEVVGKTQVSIEVADDTTEATEFITDEDEIRDIIRRAATMSWRDSIFSFDELAERLRRNDVVLPVPRNERDAYFEAVLDSIWHQQKELARIALQPLPTRVRYMLGKVEHHGIVIPDQQVAVPEVVGSLVSETEESGSEIQADEEPKILDGCDVARMIFDELMSSSDTTPRMVVGDFVVKLRNEYPDTPGALFRSVVREMVDNGFVTTYATGKRRQQKQWIAMPADVRADVLEELAERGLDTLLENVFGDQELSA